MKDILLEILTAVVIAVVPILVPYIIKFINSMAGKFENEIASKYVDEIANVVSDAVAATSQTYVDTLKAAGKFNEEAHKKAAEMALTACLESLSPNCKEFLDTAYDDITAYLMNKIESEVRNQKKGA